MITPPETPACQDTNPDYFDMDFMYPAALAICEPCPVKLWCLRQVDPARSYFDGVAGGHVWYEGKVQGKLTDPTTDPLLNIYLDERKRTR